MARFKNHLYQPMELGMRVLLDIQGAKPQSASDHVERLRSAFGMSRATAYRMVALAAYVLNREFPASSMERRADRRAESKSITGRKRW